MIDEMAAFERQLATELNRMAGSGRRVDGMAMTRAVSARAPRWTIRPIAGASRLAVVGVIVALIGGVVVFEGTTRQPDWLGAGAPSAAPVLTWSRVELPGERNWLLETSDPLLVINESGGRQYRSDDGLQWTELDVPGRVIDAYESTLLLQGFRAPNTTFDVSNVDSVSEVMWWNRTTTESALGPAGAVVVACDTQCFTSTVWHSADGEGWEVVSRVEGELWEVLTATPDGFVARAGGEEWMVLYSTDGVEWTRVYVGPHRYDILGATPRGAVLREGLDDPDFDGTLIVATADGVADLPLPAEIAPLLADPARWSFSAGGLGIVGLDVLDRRILFSPDGVEWSLEPLPDWMPPFSAGGMGGGAPAVRVGREGVLLNASVCVEPDGTETDCQGIEDEVRRHVSREAWWHGAPG